MIMEVLFIIMLSTSYHEKMQRGSRDFPVSFFHLDKNHIKYQMMAHWHNDYEVIRIISGSLRLKLNGKVFSLKENDGVFIPGNVMHSAEPVNCVYECLVFSASLFGASAKCRYMANKLGTALFSNNENINNLFEAFIKLSNGDEFMVISLLYRLAYDVIKQSNICRIPDNKLMYKIKPAIAMIEEEYSTKLTLDEMAEACGMSPNYLSCKFKEITGQTPFEYLLAYRIDCACEMLLNDSENVTEVCYKCGFNDLSYFITVFKKIMGTSPKKYVTNYKWVSNQSGR